MLKDALAYQIVWFLRVPPFNLLRIPLSVYSVLSVVSRIYIPMLKVALAYQIVWILSAVADRCSSNPCRVTAGGAITFLPD